MRTCVTDLNGMDKENRSAYPTNVTGCARYWGNGSYATIYNDPERDEQDEINRAIDDWEYNYA